jgi:hypothetical protein
VSCHSATSWSASKSCARELPAHVLAIVLQVLLLAAADGAEAGVALAQMRQVAQLVGVHRAAGAAALRVDVHVGIHEESVHEEPAAAVEALDQRPGAVTRLGAVIIRVSGFESLFWHQERREPRAAHPRSGRAARRRGGEEASPQAQLVWPQTAVTVCATFAAAAAVVELGELGLLKRT